MTHRSVRLGLAVSLMIAWWTGGCSPVEPLAWPDSAFSAAETTELRVGAAQVSITPKSHVYLAGGIPYRTPRRVHDDLWAQALVLDDGAHRIALVSLDLIGLYRDDVVRLRTAVAERTEVDYVLVACTHTHSAPDLLGFSSPLPVRHDDPYKQQLITAVSEAVAQAAAAARPAHLRIAAGDSGTPPLTHDTRYPIFIDDAFVTWQALDADTGAVIATALHYASHPILVPSLNSDVSADFVHYLRTAVVSGMAGDDGPVDPAGGLCFFFNGAIGGRITPAHAEPLTVSPTGQQEYQRAQAYGYRLAHRAQSLLRAQGELLTEPLPLAVAMRRVSVPLESDLLRLGTLTQLLDRGISDDVVESEVAIVRIGPLEMFTVPGLIFPELVRGGFGPIAGSDFPDATPEQPPLAELSRTRYFVVVGLANDLLGDIIPRCLWDEERPYTSPDGEKPYGEIIAPGPATAEILISAFAALRTANP